MGESFSPPKTGKALFAWIKDQDKKLGCGLLKSLTEWARRQNFPDRMVQWNSDQVSRAFAESCVMLQSCRAETRDQHT
jgi:hypothetical protein